MQAVAESARVITTRCRDHEITSMVMAQGRFAESLRGDVARDLGNAEMDDAAFRATLSDAKTPTAAFYYHFANGLLAYLRGEMGLAAQLIDAAAQRPSGIFSVVTTVELCLMEVLVAAEQTATASWTDRLRLGWKMRGRLRKLAHWARGCPQNFEAQWMIGRAEQARARGDAAAGPLYEQAVAAARRHGTLMREALALELYGRWLRAQGHDVESRARLTAACDVYERWGAHAKVLQMKRALAAS
jgi:hypothetical protein